MSRVMEMFNGLGWLANLIGISTALIGICAVVNKLLNSRRIPTDLSEFDTDRLDESWDSCRAKAFATVFIVDDKPADFPIKELLGVGYNIKSLKQVSLADADGLAAADIVFLDIKGIVKDDPERGGLQVIARLREKNKYQKICAVSSQRFDPTATAFFKQADDQKGKPVTAAECEQVIESFMAELFDPSSLFESLKEPIAKLPSSDRLTVITAVKEFVSGLIDGATLQSRAVSARLTVSDAHRIFSIARIVKHETV